jgi:hypothetical protein
VVTASKNGWTMKILGSLVLQPDQTIDDFAKVFYDSDKQSGSYTQVDDVAPFTTTSGAKGVTWAAHGPQEAGQQWNVAEGTDATQMTGQGSAANLASVQDDLDAMAKSIVITPASGGGGS